jgi:hypothetical protein
MLLHLKAMAAREDAPLNSMSLLRVSLSPDRSPTRLSGLFSKAKTPSAPPPGGFTLAVAGGEHRSRPIKKSPGSSSRGQSMPLKPSVNRRAQHARRIGAASARRIGRQSTTRARTAPAKKEAPATLEGGTRGRRTMGGVRPHLDYAQPTGPSKRGEHSAGPAQRRGMCNIRLLCDGNGDVPGLL